jgi:hypothetical protein
MLMSSLREGKIFVKTSTYVNSTPNIPSGASGSQALILQVKNSSVKSIWSMFGSNADYTKNPNGFYDSFCPSINSLYLEVNSIGGRFPNRPLNPINRPSECFNMFAQSIGCSNSQSYNGIISAENYNVCLPSVVAGSDFRMATTGAGVRNAYAGDDITTTTVLANNIVKFPNSFYIGFDLEKISSVLFAGVNTRSAIPTITVNLAQATATSVNVNTWGLLDIVLAFDVASKSVIAYN